MYSFMIRGARIADGSGGASYEADIALQGGRIAAIAPRLSGSGDRGVEAEGLVAAPGFIDIHTHTDTTIFSYPLAESKLLQGVTCDVTGNCGIGAFPVHRERREELALFLKAHEFVLPPEEMAWGNFAAYAATLDRLPLGINLAPLVPHGALRIAAMGSEGRGARPEDLQSMAGLLAQALEEGAWGLSTCLIYAPTVFAATEELIALGRVAAPYEALFSAHVRGEGEGLLASIEEMIRVAAESGVRVEVSHLKALGWKNWGRGTEALSRLEAARLRGVRIGADQYPYTASSTSLSALLPSGIFSAGMPEVLRRLSSPELRLELREGIRKELAGRGGPERVMVAGLRPGKNRSLSGLTLDRIAGQWSCAAEEAVIRLLLEEEMNVGAVYFSIGEEDLAAILASAQVAVGSDGRALRAEGGSAATHPRSYGTFPRVLGKFVREEGVLSLERAVYKMTGLPASRLGMHDRGFLRPGLAADLVLFDPQSIGDRATFENPHQYAAGVQYVWVNGRLALQEGAVTGEAAGRVLRKANTFTTEAQRSQRN